MAKIATSKPRVSNVVVYEDFLEFGHCRKDATVTVVAGQKIGSLVYLSGGKYVTLTATAAGTPANLTTLAVVVDPAIDTASVGDNTLAVLFRGPAGISKGGLVYGTGSWDDILRNAVYAALETLGIKVHVSV